MRISDIDNGKSFDWDNTSKDYAIRTGYNVLERGQRNGVMDGSLENCR